jgi:hypothetical protein
VPVSAGVAIAPARPLPRVATGERRRSQTRWLTLAAGLCASGPVIASTLRALVHHWAPAGDQAIIATRAYEVFTSRFPLVGQYSDSTALTHHPVYSLGPMLYWLLAVPARVGAPGSLALVIGLANTASILGAVALARRRGGLVLMLAAALAIVLMTRSLSPEGLHDVWNPSAALLPFTLLIFLCWSLACGEHRLLPLTALVASFVVQCQLTYLLPTLAAAAVAIAGLVLSRRSVQTARSRGRMVGEVTARRSSTVSRRGAAPWVVGALLVLLVCWTPPLIDQIRGNPGNLTSVARTASANRSTLGATVGWRAVVHAIGIPPWWLTDPASPWEHKNEVRTAPGAGATLSALLVICALLALAGAGVLRRKVELWAPALIGLALCAALAAVAAETPTSHLLSATLGYTLWWGSPAGMFVWLALAGPPLAALSARVRRRRRPPAGATSLWPAGVGVAIVALCSLAVAAAERPDEHLAEYRPLGALSASLARNVPSGRTVLLVGALGNSTFRFKMGARFALVRRGVRPLSPGSDYRLGSWYELGDHSYNCTIDLEDGDVRPHSTAVLLSRFTYDRRYPVSMWLWPAGCPAARQTPARPA